MGIFSAIVNRLRHRADAHAAPAPSGTQQQGSATATSKPQSASPPPASAPAAPQAAQPGTANSAQSSQAPLSHVDVDAVLSHIAQEKGGGGNYRQSIVDLLKLLDLDSSLTARKELAQELNLHAGEHGSAEQNIALHKAVMRKLAENGGKVPESMRS